MPERANRTGTSASPAESGWTPDRSRGGRAVHREGGRGGRHDRTAFRDAYATGSLDVGALAASYSSFLDALAPNGRADALAQQRYAAPGIVHRPCPREVAELQREARSAATPAIAEQLWSRCVQLEPDDPDVLLRRAAVLG